MPTTVTPRLIVEDALKELGVVGVGRPMTPEDLVDGYSMLQDMVDALQTERLTIFQTPRTVYPLTANVASYTIGSGGAFNQVRPIWISEAGIIDDNTAAEPLEIPIEVVNTQGYSRIPMKGFSASVTRTIYYDRNWVNGLGTIYVHPIPDVGTISLVLYTPVPLSEFTSVTTPYTFPPGYRLMFKKNLAILLAPQHRVSASAETVSIAAKSKADIKRANNQNNVMSVDPGLRVGILRRRFFDIRTG